MKSMQTKSTNIRIYCVIHVNHLLSDVICQVFYEQEATVSNRANSSRVSCKYESHN